jgi:FkbM family methyltransferase
MRAGPLRRSSALDMPTLLNHVRSIASGLRRQLWPTPERAMVQQLERDFTRFPRYTKGTARAGRYVIEYADAGSVWPQWDDIFVHRTLMFETSVERPRILDCGANVGVASLFFKQAYPHARITAFEADPAIADICRRNLAANGAVDVEIVPAAVWTSRGETEFVCEGSDSGAVAKLGVITGLTQKVPTVRLRDYLGERIDLLKLDIEGAELPVLEDCVDALGTVQAMTIDLHEFDPNHRQTGRVFDLLTGAGFVFDVGHLALLDSRAPRMRSPFPRPVPMWAITVRAWQR